MSELPDLITVFQEQTYSINTFPASDFLLSQIKTTFPMNPFAPRALLSAGILIMEEVVFQSASSCQDFCNAGL